METSNAVYYLHFEFQGHKQLVSGKPQIPSQEVPVMF